MKKRLFKVLKVAVIVVLMMSLVGSFPALAAKKIKIVLWHCMLGPDGEVLKAHLDKYQRMNPNVKIEIAMFPLLGLRSKYNLAVANGQGPDILLGQDDWVGAIVNKGNLEPLDKWIVKDKKLLKQYLPLTVDGFKYRGKIYGLPQFFESIALIYNTNLVKKPPKDTGELIAMGKGFMKRGIYGLAYDAKDIYYSACWFHGFGATLLDENGKPGFNSHNAVKAARFIAELYLKHKIMPKELDTNVMTSLFNDGKAAMLISGPWALTGEYGISKAPFKIARIPMVKETGKWPAPYVGIRGIMMNKFSKNKAAAFKLMKYLSSAQVTAELAVKSKLIPANLGAYKVPAIKNDPVINAFRDQAEVGVPMPNSVEMAAVWGPGIEALGLVWNGKKTPEAAMKDAQEKILEGIESLEK